MPEKNSYDSPHRRFNALTGEWVQVSPQRMKRPWQGKEEDQPPDTKPEYDDTCYLCPGNSRAGGNVNDNYTTTYIFDNDFSALLPEEKPFKRHRSPLLKAKPEKGVCRVICFSPKHNLTLPELSLSELKNVVEVWVDQYRELSGYSFINYVQIFENKGEIMGCSNPHPHGQIWAQESIPDEPAKELKQQKAYYEENGNTLLEDYLSLELNEKKRVVTENDDFVVLVPYWAFWPYETIVIPRRRFSHFYEMSSHEQSSLADIIKKITTAYDNLFEISFPYSAGFHPAPSDGRNHPYWHFHMHFYPPLLRSATIKKFRVGYEMLASPQRDITAEYVADLLRKQPSTHYKYV